jgi:hypothetical protein
MPYQKSERSYIWGLSSLFPTVIHSCELDLHSLVATADTWHAFCRDTCFILPQRFNTLHWAFQFCAGFYTDLLLILCQPLSNYPQSEHWNGNPSMEHTYFQSPWVCQCITIFRSLPKIILCYLNYSILDKCSTMKIHSCTLKAMFSYCTVALHIHFVAWCCWCMKLLSRYQYMLLVILGSLAFHVSVIMVCPGGKWYTLVQDVQAHSGWRMWVVSLSEYPDCIMKSSSTVRWKTVIEHFAASIFGLWRHPWLIHQQNEMVDSGSVSLG